MMEEKPRLEVLTTPSNFDGVRLQTEKAIEKNRDFFNFKMSQVPHMEVAIEALKKGTGDLLAMSVKDWKRFDVEGLKISAFLPRREPTWVLVSDDKPEYLPYNAIVICDNQLIIRQLKRMREDINIQTSEGYFNSINTNYSIDELDKHQHLENLEQLRIDEDIDGYVISRGEFSQTKTRLRRHTLGMQREKPSQEFERSTFISPPLEGFSILVSRNGFPTNVIERINDKSARLCFEVENSIYESLDDNLKQIAGIYVEQKKLSTILKQYVKLIDDSYALKIGENYLIPSTKKSRDSRTKWNVSRNIIQGPRICIYFEILDNSGNVSLEMIRIEPLEDNLYDRGKNVIITEIKFLLELLQQDHDELKRLISGLPEEYKLPRPGILKL
ncbi:MAG: hypothetical protein ISP82_04535 [Candidatus Poseidoniaceae archaeon]|nr:hypothetical protein [Candidatus Poseidoniaceae archaeon]